MKIGSNNIFAEQSRIFCHSIENGKVKLKRLTIGDNCLISCWSSIQGGIDCGNNVELKPGAIPLHWYEFSSLYNIRETLKSGTKWMGAPASRFK